jgi:hypothetical protein
VLKLPVVSRDTTKLRVRATKALAIG